VKQAKLFKTLQKKIIKCTACQRYCTIEENKVGFCATRKNINGQLYSLIYGVLNGIQTDPIEKKPIYHFMPGTQVLSFGAFGCNYRCKQCLNFHCSWGEPGATILKELREKSSKEKIVEPEQIVNLAKEKNIPGIAFTYNEPSIWPEYVHDVAKLAKKNKLFTVYVSNGSWTKENLNYVGQYIDCCNIDIKGFFKETYEKMGAYLGQVLELTEIALKKYKILIELTTLIIPTINDSEKEIKAIANWVCQKLGPETPWHLSRYDPNLAPDNQFKKLPLTSRQSLNKAYNIGKKAGLKHIYVWAPPKDVQEEPFSIGNTICPNCGKLVIKRSLWRPKIIGLKQKNNKVFCQNCDYQLNIKI
jgi:pyruvate formate lyase activating enzyme